MKWFLLFFCAIINEPIFAQSAPTWAWARAGVNSAISSTVCVTTDKDHNVFSAGNFTGSIAFGANTYNSQGTQNIYITKHDNDGNLLWSKAILGPGKYIVHNIVCDHNGDLCIGVTYASDTPVANVANQHILIFKYNRTGQLVWSKWYGSSYDDYITGLAVDSKNNYVLAGIFFNIGSSPALIDSIRLDNIVLKSKGNGDIFLAKMDSSGTIFWAKDIGSNGNDYVNALSVLPNDEIAITGTFENRLKIDSLPQLLSISTGFVSSSCFVAKFDSTGIALWDFAIGGRNPSTGSTPGIISCDLISSDPLGEIVVGGRYSDCDLRIQNRLIPPNDYYGGPDNLWYAKLNTNGILQWINHVGGNWSAHLGSLQMNSKNDIYIVGNCGDATVFGTDTLFTSQTGSILFIGKYDELGNLKWLKANYTDKGSGASGIAINQIGEILVSGGFGDSLVAFDQSVVRNRAQSNGFIAKLKIEGVGINQISKSDFELFPNPAKSTINLRFNENQQFNSYRLYNSLSQIIASGKFNTTLEQSIFLPTLSDGIYYLNMKGRNGNVTRKIWVKK